MSRKINPTGKIVYATGCNGFPGFRLDIEIPLGKKKKRAINVYLEATAILAMADAIRCCPDHIMETYRTGKKGLGEEAVYANIGHAEWHMRNPDRPRPCLPSASVIETSEALPMLEAECAAANPKKGG